MQLMMVYFWMIVPNYFNKKCLRQSNPIRIDHIIYAFILHSHWNPAQDSSIKKAEKKQQNYDEAKQKQQRKWEKKEFHKIAYEM